MTRNQTVLFLNFVLLFSTISSAFAIDAQIELPKKVNLNGLSTDEIAVYQHGEIGTGALIGGGLLGTLVGLGTGHIVYGKYGSKGWIFTVGELGSVAVMVAGATSSMNCLFDAKASCSNSLAALMFGEIAYFGFRIWEIIDVWTLPSGHNTEYRALKARVEGAGGPRFSIMPMISSLERPVRDSFGRESLGYGLQLNMEF
jgi:hypothetical protein